MESAASWICFRGLQKIIIIRNDKVSCGPADGLTTMAIGSHKGPIGKTGEARNRNSPHGKDCRAAKTPRKG
jgi:hypothetical protein